MIKLSCFMLFLFGTTLALGQTVASSSHYADELADLLKEAKTRLPEKILAEISEVQIESRFIGTQFLEADKYFCMSVDPCSGGSLAGDDVQVLRQRVQGKSSASTALAELGIP